MKQIQKDELYNNLSEFLKGKGVELKEGPYTKGIHAGVSMLADAINLSQAGLDRARTEIGRKVDQVRQVIHERTAPRSAGTGATAGKGTSTTRVEASAAPTTSGGSAATGKTARPGRKTQARGSRRKHK